MHISGLCQVSNNYTMICPPVRKCEFRTTEIETKTHHFWLLKLCTTFLDKSDHVCFRYNITMQFSLKFVILGITDILHRTETQVKKSLYCSEDISYLKTYT